MDSNDDICDISRLSFVGDFDQQVEEIMQYIRLTRQEVESLQLLFDDLHKSLSIVWPGCKVHGFGSIVTGLGIKTSDIDCYVELPSWFYPPERPFVIQARNILRQRPQIYQELFSLTSAKIPIVKFYHKPTRRSCDVNFTSMAGVCNSALINYFINLDRKILYVSILVKYWAKIHNLTGLNMMSNYCLTLLVVFYLQQKNILPSVKHLQEKIDEYFVDCWNSAFRKDNQFSQIKETLYQLLGGFFKYYSTFNFEKLIVSPYVGKPIDRDLFSKIESVPLEFQLYKINVSSSSECKPIRLDRCMCVQDPFEHNRNCAVSVHQRIAEDIVSHFRKASEIFDSMDDKSFLRQLLIKIGSNKPRNRKRKKPALVNGVKKKYKQNLNIQQNVKFIAQNYFKAKNERRE